MRDTFSPHGCGNSELFCRPQRDGVDREEERAILFHLKTMDAFKDVCFLMDCNL